MRRGSISGAVGLEDVVVEFSKFEPHSNSDKVFRIEVARDLFCNMVLQITKGRRGRKMRVVVRGHASETDLRRDLLCLCARRFEHGYSLCDASLTDDLVPYFDRWTGEAADQSDTGDLELALFQSLSLLRSRLAASVEFEDLDDAFHNTIFSLDPQNQSASRNAKRSVQCQLELPELPIVDGQNFLDPRRRVVRFFVEHLLRDDPLVAHSIFRVLQVPGRFQGDNIVNLASIRPSNQGARQLRLLTLVEQEPGLSDIGERLFFAKIKTAADLMVLSEADLRCEFRASDTEIALMRYALGVYGLRLSADTYSQVKA